MKLLNAITPEQRNELRSFSRALVGSLFEQVGRGRAEDIVKGFRDERASLLLRAAVSPTSRADFPTHKIVSVFRSLAPTSAAFSLFERSTQIDLSGIDTVAIPNSPATASTAPVFIAEGGPAPVLALSFAATTLGPARKILVIATESMELEHATPGGAAAVLGRVLSDRVGIGVDKVAFSSAAATSAAPAGLLFGATGVTATTPSATIMPDVAAAFDIGNLFGAIGAAGIDPIGAVLVASPAVAGRLMALLGETEIPILMTNGLTDKTLAAISPQAVASGYSSAPTVEYSKDTTLHQEAATPAELVSSPGVVSAPQRSVFQTNAMAVKVRATCAWCCQPGGAAVISGGVLW
jgi:hypothetical protein